MGDAKRNERFVIFKEDDEICTPQSVAYATVKYPLKLGSDDGRFVAHSNRQIRANTDLCVPVHKGPTGHHHYFIISLTTVDRGYNH